ncbi:kinesin-like protein KIF20A [Diachasma alloeum]|uniref:kinesin-like protein KIF20A n=1 Tax=Diachasma alloeum TaxID=454923 RepID=UPI0007383091|nr:kinesin-like protein KIF20A [Diachasma alloeum]
MMSETIGDVSRNERLLDSIRPSEGAVLRNEMSYLYGRDPSILAYSQRPGPSAQCKKNLSSDYEIEESMCPEGASLGSESLSSQTVKVYLRLKPFPRKIKLSDEQEAAYEIINCTTLLTRIPCLDSTTISLKKNCQVDTVCRKFTFTETFGPGTSQLTLFERVIQPQMVEFFGGQNCIAMTYGTTNSGKSHTLQGSTSCPGIIPRSLEYVFSNINPKTSPCYKPLHNCDVISLSASERLAEIDAKTKILSSIIGEKHQYINAYKQMQKLLEEESPQRPSEASDAQYLVWVSFAEIYNEVIYDLLSNEAQRRRTPLKLATDNHGRAFIKGLKTVCVNSGSEAYQVLMAGQCNLKVAATALNARSSRSHCIFTITLLQFYGENKPESVEISRFSFCDLAGSERLKKTLNVGDRLREAQNINTSLLVLGRCLKSIYEGQLVKQRHEHIGPFRESKLTRLFQQALSGKEPLALIVNVNPLPNLYEETQNVLNFAAIAKKIIIQPKKEKRRRSRTRFSLVVAQSAKTATDWEDTDLEIITEQSSLEAEESESNFSFLQEDYDELLAENERLKHENAALKASNIKRDIQIREEMANSYSEMMDKLERDYKAKMQDMEDQQEDLLEWQLSRLRAYYEKKLACNKRKRSDDDDEEEEDEASIKELEAQVSKLSSEVTSLKGTIKDLRRGKESLEGEKNTLIYESSLLKDELKSVKALLASMEADVTKGEANVFVVELKEQLSAAREKIKYLKDMLNNAKIDHITIEEDYRAEEGALAQLKAKYADQTERCQDLEKELEDANALLRVEVQVKEELENQLEREIQLRAQAEKQLKMLKGEMNSTKTFIKQEMLSPTMEDSSEASQSREVFLEFRDIPVENHDQSGVVEGLKREIQLLEEERNSLSEKLSQSVGEVDSLREDLRSAKERLDEITVQLAQMKTSRLSSAEIICDDGDTKQEGNAEVSPGVDQVIQTSFSAPVNEHKSLQTTLNGTEELGEVQKELEDLKNRYEALKSQHEDQVSRIQELTDELATARGNLEARDDQERKLVEEIQQLQLRLSETSREKEDLSRQVEQLQKAPEDLEAELREHEKNLGLLEIKMEDLQKSEEVRTEESRKLKEELASCESEYNAQILELKEKLTSLEARSSENNRALEERVERIQQLEARLEQMERLENEISEANALVLKCQSEKTQLEIEVKKNEEKISQLTSQLEQSTLAGRDKDDEIVRLQKEVKSHITKIADVSGDADNEKAHKRVIQELSETRESLERYKKLNEELETKVRNLVESRNENYEQTQNIIASLQQNILEQKAEIKDLKTTNASIITSLDEKEVAMENFKRNRDEMIAKYEVLVKNLQEDLEREKREVMRFQELFSRQALTPREKEDSSMKFRAPSDDRTALKQRENKGRDDNTSDEVSPKSSSSRRPRRGRKAAVPETSNDENDIPVIELSGSESKRTTRKTAAATAAPPSEKRPGRRKKLFNPDQSLVDITPEEVTPSPASTRSMRARRK